MQVSAVPAADPLLRAGGPALGLAWGVPDGRDAIQGLQDPDDGPQRAWWQLCQGPTVMDDHHLHVTR